MDPFHLLAAAVAPESGVSTTVLVAAITGGFAIVAALVTGFLAFASRKNVDAVQATKGEIDDSLIEWVQKATRAEAKADLALESERRCHERLNALEGIVNELSDRSIRQSGSVGRPHSD